MPSDGLEPISPTDAVQWYLEHRHDELREATRRAHRSALGIFTDWTAETDLTNMNVLSGRDLMAFKTWRKSETDIKTVSLNGTLAVLQRFLRFCETIEAVEEDLADREPLPNVPPDEEVRTDVSKDEAVEGIREYYRRFEYASRHHAQFELVAEVGIRLGALRAIDIGDFNPDEEVVHLQHRSESPEVYGTPLKNGTDGELPVIAQTLENLESGSEIAVTTERDDGRELNLDEEERYVLAALQEEPGSALRVIHRTATEIAGSPFDDYQQEDGWNDERQNVRSILWSFEEDDIVRNDGQLWYPTDDTPTDLLE